MYRLLMISIILFLLSFTGASISAQEGVAVITSPLPVSELSGVVTITGTVKPSNLGFYFLEVAELGREGADVLWIPITLPQTIPVEEGALASWDTTRFPNGLYRLRLQVVLASGQTIFHEVEPLRITNAAEVIPSTITPTPLPTNYSAISGLPTYKIVLDEALTYRGIAASLLDDQNIGAVAVHLNGEIIAALVERDSAGNVVEVSGAIWMNPEGLAVVLYFGEDGLPEKMITNGTITLFSNYTDRTVDIATIFPDGTVQTTLAADIDPEYLAALRELRASYEWSSAGVRLSVFRAVDLQSILKVVSLTTGAVSCAVSLKACGGAVAMAGVATGATVGVAAPVAAGGAALACLPAGITCGSLVIRTILALRGEESPLLEGTSMAVAAASCATGGDVVNCYDFLVSEVALLTAVASATEQDLAPVVAETRARRSPTATATATPQRPCVVRTTRANSVAARVGPGTNRTSLVFMPANQDIRVTGQAAAFDNSMWWQIEIPGRSGLVWVPQQEVSASGACNNVPMVAPPPIIPISTPTPVPPTAAPLPSGESIQFTASRTEITAGECVTLRWDVEGVQAVYYQGRGVTGHSSQQECPASTTTYTLEVITRSGSSVRRQVTVNVGGSINLGTGDVQVTLRWNNIADLDLHVREPNGTEIYFGNPSSSTGGQLDVDANYPCGSNLLYVENIFWPRGTAPSGTYQVQVVQFQSCGASSSPNWSLTVLVDGRTVLSQSGTGSSGWFTFSR